MTPVPLPPEESSAELSELIARYRVNEKKGMDQMAQSTCIKCGSNRFELQEIRPKDALVRMHAVQCSLCGGVVGVILHDDIAAMLRKQNELLTGIAIRVGAVQA